MKGMRGERLLDICKVVLHFGRGQAPKKEKKSSEITKTLKPALVQEVEKVCYSCYPIDKREKNGKYIPRCFGSQLI
jgi:hypothetical protein